MGFADYQNEVYLNGLGDQTPAFPVGWRELEAAGLEAMTPQARGYVGGGAGVLLKAILRATPASPRECRAGTCR